jgi:polyhydroxyalkanoate synthesis regulator phasin
LMRLRPVTFHPRSPNPDGSKPLQYGLIAEEVAGVYPEFVARGKDGQLEAAQFSKLPILLLNELQKQYRQIQEQSLQIQALQRLEQSNLLQRERIQRLEARLAALEAQLSTNATAPATPGEGHNH